MKKYKHIKIQEDVDGGWDVINIGFNSSIGWIDRRCSHEGFVLLPQRNSVWPVSYLLDVIDFIKNEIPKEPTHAFDASVRKYKADRRLWRARKRKGGDDVS